MKNKREAAKVLAKVIEERTTDVRDALFDSGVTIAPNADYDEVIIAVLSNLGFNKRLQKKIGKLAVEVSPQSFPQLKPRKRVPQRNMTGFYNQGGDEKFFQTEAGTQVLDTTGQIAGTLLANWLAQKQAKKQAEIDAELAESQSKLLEANAELVKANLAYENIKLQQASVMTPSSRLMIGVLIVGALIAGFYFMQKPKATAQA